MEFGEFLRMKRMEKGMTIRQVALYAQCSDSYLSMLERGIVGQRGPTPTFLKKLVKPLGIPYEVLMAAAGYTLQTKDDILYSGDLLYMLRDSLGDTAEEFAKRVSMSTFEVETLERNGVSYEILHLILQKVFIYDRALTTRQKSLIHRMADTFLKLPSRKYITVELLFHALLEIIEEDE